MNLTMFDVVARPAASSILNRFHPHKPPTLNQHISIMLHKKYVISWQWANGTSEGDPDHPIMYAPLPMSPAQLGTYLQNALSKSSCHEHIRHDDFEGRAEYIKQLRERAIERSKVIKSQLKAGLGVDVDTLEESHS